MLRGCAVAGCLLLFTTSAFGQVAGTVLDASTGQPIEGARVSIQASEFETLTDASGSFSIPDASGDLVVVAGAQGWFYASQAGTAPIANITLSLEPVPSWDDPSFTFSEPESCASCHPQQFAEWSSSPMAKAGDNTWVYDTYDGTGTPGGMGGFVYLRDSALAAANPASECASCHQPEPWVDAPYTPLEPIAELSTGSLHGISCQVCHQIADVEDDKPSFPGLWPGVVAFQRPPPGEVVMYGQLGDVTYGSGGIMRAAYQPELSALVCATCHQDKNDPDLDGDFEEDDGVISEPTYLEWLASRYADPGAEQYATCVDCHMPPSGAANACVVQPGLERPFGDVREHRFRGTDAEFLENALSIELSASVDGGSLDVHVTVNNDRTGHHVPTGVTVRNAILLVEAFRVADGTELSHTGQQVVHELGGVGDPADGYFAGLPGKLFAKLNHDAEGNGPTFFTDAAGITFDTRIPALSSDETSYTFALPEEGGEIGVRARVIYRRAWRALVDAKSWVADGHGQPLEDIAAPHFGHLMGQAETTVSTPPQGTGGAGGGSGAGGETGGVGGGPGGSGGEGRPPGGGQDEEDGSGCDCRSGGASRGAPRGSEPAWHGWVALGVLVLGVGRRRSSPPPARRWGAESPRRGAS